MSFLLRSQIRRHRVATLRPLACAQHVQRCYNSGPVITGITEQEITSSRKYCLNLLKNLDAPSFTLSTFVPPSARDAFLALRAFNVEIARVADATSNAAVGALRMQYWRDAVSKALDYRPPKEPVAVMLSYVAADLEVRTEGKTRLSRSWLNRLVNTREQYLDNPPFANLSALETYAENTYSTLMYLTLSGVPVSSVTADHIASHIGKAQGIAAVLRGLPILAFPGPPNKHSNQTSLGGQLQTQKQGTIALPLDVMAESGVREEDILRHGAEAKGLRDAVFAVATRANDHLITAREMTKNIRAGQDVGHDFEHQHEEEHQSRPGPPEAESQVVERCFGVYMPAIATQLWLDRLQKSNFDIFDQKLRKTDWLLPWRAYWAFSRRRF